MNKFPLVSIVAGTYNSAAYVLEALDSIAAQTYRNIELVITDDGSSDETVNLCRSWLALHGQQFARMQLITSEKNTGIPANCNRGLNACKGDWLKYLAGDDTLVPTCVADNVNYLRSHPDAVMIQSNCRWYRERIKADCYIGTSKLQDSAIFRPGISAAEQQQFLLIKNRLLATTMFLKREVLSQTGGFDERLTLIEDLPLWIKLTGLGFKIEVMKTATYNYRKSGDSVRLHRQPFMRTSYARELLLFHALYKKGRIPFSSAVRYKWGLKLIVLLNQLGINKRGRLNALLFKAAMKVVN